ncbi:UvrD-helicase domain-containing protein [Coriobacteriia bacterium Es71-Z0120]|uniref:ATP-dependent helicase n=1 Tax=Parvivirga hydrogeniphila TaxID=2939460 RepID=UPI002260CEAB|nr:UvrD-helicase domain-containing protein [Parvivirga hydrogeniphila]MCL4078606.1 UvrD-helicase domain-containing protein [Parvivirga hydrogeniphila]
MSNLLDGLNPAQRDAVTTTEGPLLVLAGAGSGKTRVLTHRVAYLVRERGVSPAEILAITFTNKAANEMRERLERLIGPAVRGMWVMTFHAFCVRLLRAEAYRLGMSRQFTIYDEDDTRRMLATVAADLDLDPKRYSPKMLASRISTLKNELALPDAAAERAVLPPEKVTAKAYAAYQARLMHANAMDFDDLLVNAWLVLSQHDDARAFYQRRFRYILVDEYQDTNHAQYEIVNLLAAGHRNLMVVGDDDQSIYSWRGADIRNILDFEKDYPEATVIRLEQNYRSTQTILAAANAVVANNLGRKPKTLWTANVGGEAIVRYVAQDERDEARFVAEEIERLRASESRAYADFAVFYRTNAQSRVIEDVFLRAGVPYRLVGGTRFFDRAEIRDVMAWLKAVVNPSDVQSYKRLMGGWPGVGKTTIDAVEARALATGIPIGDAVRSAVDDGWVGGAARNRLGELRKALEAADAAARAEGPLRERVEAIVAAAGIVSRFLAEGTDEAKGRVENVAELLGVVEEYDAVHEEPEARTLEAFLEWAALRTDLDQLAEGDDAATLMTLHTAKGLEFPVVFLVGLEDGIFPHANSMYDPQRLEEERRLMYVGVTRARERLYITHAHTRSLYGSDQWNPPSRFITEIPEEYVSTKGVGSSGFGTSAPGRGRGDRGGSLRWASSSAQSGDTGGRVFGAGQQRRPRERETLVLAPGDRVEHKTFGKGTVREVKGDAVVVEFAGLGTKKLLLGYAPLRKIDG